jgi:MFS family permease
MEDQKKIILKDFQIKKFALYGFLKDLKFFEPYLLIYLTGNDITLLQIGILYAIREIIINVFEIPSGFIADYFGRKKELSFCFLMYIISFVFFFYSSTFGIAVVAMIFFGLGEAFRSGTHKAMIFTYLEEKNWTDYKTFVYGKTRSASLVGAAISSILAIIIILNVPSNGYIFLASIIPYLLDFVLILSYPKSLDNAAKGENVSFRQMFKTLLDSIKGNKNLRHILIGEGLFEGAISSIKDFIQAILELIIVGTGVVLFTNLYSDSVLNQEANLNIILGVSYMFINIFGAISSRNSYRLKKHASGVFFINALFIVLTITLAALGLLMNYYYAVIIFYIFIYIAQNLRKPIFIDELDNDMPKTQRATMLSIASQLKSLFVIIASPIIGWVSDTYGINYAIIGLAVFLMLCIPLTWITPSKKVEQRANL